MARRLEIPGARYLAQGGLGVAVPRAIPMPPAAPSIPATIPGARQDAAAAGAVGRMIAGLGGQLMDQGFRQQAEELAFQEQQLKARRASDNAETKGRFLRSMIDLELEATKDPDPVGAPGRFQEKADQLRTQLAEGLTDPVTRRNFTQDTEGLLATKIGNVKEHAWKREAAGRRAGLVEILADLGASAGAAASDVERVQIDQEVKRTLAEYQQGGFIDEAQMIGYERGYKQAWQLTKAERLETDNPRLLAQMIEKGAFPDINPVQREKIRGSALRLWKAEERERRSDARAAHAAAVKEWSDAAADIQETYRRGYIPDPKRERATVAALERLGETKMVAKLDRARRTFDAVEGFQTLPAAEQSKILAARDAPQDAESAAQLDMMGKVYQETLRRREDDALGLAQERGLLKLSPIDFSNVEALARSFGQRQTQGRMAQEQYGTAFPQILTKAEAGRFKDMLDQADPRSRAEMIGALRLGLDPDAFDGMARTLWKADPMTGLVAGLAASDGGLPVARSVAEGDQLRKKDSKLAPATLIDPEIKAGFADAFREMPALGQTFADGVKAQYAFLAARAGRTDAATLDRGLFNQAVNDVTGGLVTHNGGTLVAPRRGMDDARFDRMIARLVDQDLKTYSLDGEAPTDASGKPLTAQVLRDAKLVSVGEGRYAVEIQVRKPGAWFAREPKFLMGATGRRYVIDLGLAVDAIESRSSAGGAVTSSEGVIAP